MIKVWHKPLHKRKVWKEMSLTQKVVYYVQPFVLHLIQTWLQPLPFPTLFKILYSLVLIILILLPVIYPLIVIICYYAIVQYLVESDFNIRYHKNFDVIHYVSAIFKFQISNEKHAAFVNLYLERYQYLTTALASCIDYLRLALSLLSLFNFISSLFLIPMNLRMCLRRNYNQIYNTCTYNVYVV